MSDTQNRSVIVLIGGGHASGKATTVSLLVKELHSTIPSDMIEVITINLSDYEEAIDGNDNSSKKLEHSAISYGDSNRFSQFRPSRFRFDKLREELLSHGETPGDQKQKIYLIYGLYALYDKALRSMSQLKVFISSDPDTRLVRWIRRDVVNGTQSLESVINGYLQGARIEMRNFIFPTKEFADVIMPNGAETNAVRLIVDGMIQFLASRADPEGMYIPSTTGNYLRPGNDGFFGKDIFDSQKESFYELS